MNQSKLDFISRAIEQKKGIHSGVTSAVTVRIRDVSQVNQFSSKNAAKAQQYLHFLQRGKIQGIVEFVLGPSRYRITVPKESCILTLSLEGIRTPRVDRTDSSKSEPFANEAHSFAQENFMQRDVLLY